MVQSKKLRDLNPWLDNPRFSYEEKSYRTRFIYDTIVQALDLKLMISISGLRRVGKTTLLRQLAEHVRKEKGSLLYYQFDEYDTDLTGLLEYYFEFVVATRPAEVRNMYIFLDELQYVEHWQDTLKYYYDMNRQIQFIVTGSISLYLHKDTKESLAGRIIDFPMHTLSFDEYLWLHSGKRIDAVIDFKLPGDQLYEAMCQRQQALQLYHTDVYRYFIQGEFPETVSYTNYEFVKKYLVSSVVDKIITKDIDIFQVRKTEEFYALYKAVLQNTAQVISIHNMSADLGIARQTVETYLQVMEKAFLVELLNNYRRSVRAQEKSMDKVFSQSINLLCAVLYIRDVREIMYPDFAGHIIETYVLNQLRKTSTNIEDIYYLNKERKEIDFVIHAGQRLIPAEVKMKNEISKVEMNRVRDFLDKHNQDFGFFYYAGECTVLKLDNGKKIYCLNWV